MKATTSLHKEFIKGSSSAHWDSDTVWRQNAGGRTDNFVVKNAILCDFNESYFWKNAFELFLV